MAERTLNFPKLKNTNQTATTITLHSLTRTLKTIPIQQPQAISRLPSFKEKLAQRKYIYINKSPEYFKRRQNSQYYLKPHRQTDGTILEDLSEQMKKFEKTTLESANHYAKLFKNPKKQKTKQSSKKVRLIDDLLLENSNYDNFKAPCIAVQHLFSRMGV